MLNPNDAAYLLQKIYPVYVRYSKLGPEEKIRQHGFPSFLDAHIRAGLGLQLHEEGTLGYAIAGLVEGARQFIARGDEEGGRRSQLISDAILSYEQATQWLKRKGKNVEMQGLLTIIAGSSEREEFLRLWPRCATQLKVYARDLPTLEKALRAKLYLIEQQYASADVMHRAEDLKDLRSLLSLIRHLMESRHDKQRLFNAHQRLDMLVLHLQHLGSRAVRMAPGDLLEGLTQVLCALFRKRLHIPPSDPPKDCLWGLSESSFLALCVSASQCTDLEEIRIIGRDLRHPLPSSAMNALCAAIQSSPHLTVLDLRYNKLEGHAWQPLTRALQDCKKLNRIHLDGNALGEPGCDYLAGGIEPLQELMHLSLRDCAVDEAAIQSLADIAEKQAYLRSLNLDNNPLSEAACLSIAQILRQGKLHDLSLNHCPIGDNGARYLCPGIKEDKQLRHLRIESCELTNRGIEALREAAAEHSPPLHLDTSGNHVEVDPSQTIQDIHRLKHDILKLLGKSPQGDEIERLVHQIVAFTRKDEERAPRIRLRVQEALEDGLGRLHMRIQSLGEQEGLNARPIVEELHELYLRFHPDKRVQTLATQHESMSSSELTQLLQNILQDGGLTFGDEGCSLLRRLLSDDKIQVLTLKEQEIGPHGADELGDGIAKTRELSQLEISDTPLGDRGIINVGLGLLTNHSLRQLTLRDCGMQENGARSLGDSICGNQGLHSLVIDQADLTPEASSALLAELARNTTLRQLSLLRASFDEEVVNSLCTLLEKHPKLETLELSRIPLSLRDVEKIADSIAKNRSLKSLSLTYCDIDDDGCFALDQVLAAHPSIQRLDISHNALTDEGKALLLARSEMVYMKKV